MVSDQETLGGAAVAAARLAQGLYKEGHEVIRLVEQSDGETHDWLTVRWEDVLRPRHKLFTKAGRRPSALYEQSAAHEFAHILGELDADIVNLHNLHSAVGSGWSPRMLAAAAAQAPTVWTLHDMWSFTGGCNYSFGSREYTTGCNDACLAHVEHDGPLRDVGASWRLRKGTLSISRRISAVAPSSWLAASAAAGLWGRERVSVIPYGVPLDIYRPLDRAGARAELGLPQDRRLLLTVAQRLDDRRKGLDLLQAALDRLGVAVGIITLGEGESLRPSDGVSVHELGYLSSEDEKVWAFNAADALVHPAVADNLPNVVIEAMACGTPTVGFPVGGLIDLVRPQVTGWLAEDVSVASLTAAIEDALANGRADAMRDSCRRIAQSEYGERRQAVAYIDLFERMSAVGG